MKQRGRKKVLKASLSVVAVLALAYLTYAFAQRQVTRPRRAATSSAKIITVRPGDNLQRALNAAAPGDEVVLEAGAVYVGTFVLPVKPGESYVTLRSSRCAELPETSRVSPADSALMARLATPSVAPVVLAPPRSHHWRLQCLELTQAPALAASPGDSYAWSYNLVQLGEGGAGDSQNSLESVPHHLELDRVVIRARDARTMTQRGITLNSAHTVVRNSHISDIKWPGVETQALGGWNGPGPFQIENNYLEAAGINILFGGAKTLIPGLVPSDITIRRNTLSKRPEWRGMGYSAKNFFELKNARRVQFTDNDCENSWPDGQTGWAVILNALGEYGPASVIEDVEIARNVFRSTANGINLRGMEPGESATRMRRITVSDNLLDNLGAYDGEGKAFQVLYGTEDIRFDHNTVGGRVSSALILEALASVKHSGFQFTNNLTPHGLYGVFGAGGLVGTSALTAHATNWKFVGNALYAKPSDVTQSYPPGNHFPATPLAAAGLMGTDGRPAGARTQATPTPAARVTPGRTIKSLERGRAPDDKDLGGEVGKLEAATTRYVGPMAG